jgi:hypothetical protein
VIGPAGATASVTASEIVFYVAGTDAQSKFSLAVNISPKSSVKANIYAPNGTLLLNSQTQATGAFLAKDVTIGQQGTVALKSAFTGMVPLFTIQSALQGGATASSGAPEQTAAEIPVSFVLDQNYPNPFNPSTRIRYGLPRQSRVTITVHNLLGQEIARLTEGEQGAGYHEVQWNGTNASGVTVGTGVYFYRIQAADFVELRKMLLVK